MVDADVQDANPIDLPPPAAAPNNERRGEEGQSEGGWGCESGEPMGSSCRSRRAERRLSLEPQGPAARPNLPERQPSVPDGPERAENAALRQRVTELANLVGQLKRRLGPTA